MPKILGMTLVMIGFREGAQAATKERPTSKVEGKRME
jgi:hypothetical protein